MQVFLLKSLNIYHAVWYSGCITFCDIWTWPMSVWHNIQHFGLTWQEAWLDARRAECQNVLEVFCIFVFVYFLYVSHTVWAWLQQADMTGCLITCHARLYRIAWQCSTSCEKYEIGDNFTTRTMGDEKPIRVRPTRSSFSNNNVQVQTSQVENIGNTVAFGWAELLSA